ncbi:hypothetical protein NQ317_013931 [Molorchus minor]|uniref:Uncharacterized protein n=1 Tax=Molorchus minor TaxID=1323400 RepID=A0ABQ9K603_9CUCU|nr:hypothetical protein NQ317_013931 [Molorchus minor]
MSPTFLFLFSAFIISTVVEATDVTASGNTLFPPPNLDNEPKKNLGEASLQTEEMEDDLDDVFYFDDCKPSQRGKKDVKTWDHWGKWSPCSVTCGVGKMTRWRHCVSDSCSPGEKRHR